MQITSNDLDPGIIVLKGRFDANECEAFDQHMDRFKATNPSVLSFDVSGVDFIDSSALASLVGLSKWADGAGVTFSIRNPSDPVRVILELTAFDRILTVVDEPVTMP